MTRYLALALLLVGCATQAPVKATLATCDGIASALLVAHDLDVKGNLSSDDRRIILDVLAVTRPVCGTGAPPVDATSTASVLAPAALQLTTILQRRGAL